MEESTDIAMIEELRSHGLRATSQRLAILKALRDDTRHPSAEQLFDTLKTQFATMSLSTVYKGLQTLAAAGVIQTIDGGKSRQRFEGRPVPHHHAVCIRCGRVFDIDYDKLPLDRIDRDIRPDFEVTGVKLYFTGHCRDCGE